MAVDPNSLLSTPISYATPEQVAQARQYADLMNKQASSGEQIRSPYQGFANITRALMGGLEENEANRAEAQGRYAAALTSGDALAGNMMGGPKVAPAIDTRGLSAATLHPGTEDAGLSWGAGIVPMDAAKAAISYNESGGNYREIGPMVLHGSYAGDQALGKYQVMGKDLQDRLMKAGLPRMSPSQFLLSKEAQEAEFEHEFGGLMNRYGSFNDAASMWFSGHPMRANDRSNDGYMGTPAYISKANRTLKSWFGQNPNAPLHTPPGQTMSDAGPIGGPGSQLAQLVAPGTLAQSAAPEKPTQDNPGNIPTSQSPATTVAGDQEPPAQPKPGTPADLIAQRMGPSPSERIAASMGPTGGPSPSERVAHVMGARGVPLPNALVAAAHAAGAPGMPGLTPTDIIPGQGNVGGGMPVPPMPAVPPPTMPPVQPMVGGSLPMQAPLPPPTQAPTPPPTQSPAPPPAVSPPAAPPVVPGLGGGGAPIPPDAAPMSAMNRQVVGPGGNQIQPPVFRQPATQIAPRPPLNTPPSPAQDGRPPMAGGWRQRTPPSQMRDPQTGILYPVDPNDVYPHVADHQAFINQLANPWMDQAQKQMIYNLFAPRTMTDINGNEFLYRPNAPPVLTKRSLGTPTEVKVGDTTLHGFVHVDENGRPQTIVPGLNIGLGGGGESAPGSAGGGTGGGAGVSPPGPSGGAPAGPLGSDADRLKEWQIQQEARAKTLEEAGKEKAKADIAFTNTTLDNATKSAQDAQLRIPQTELAMKVARDPNFKSGPLHNWGDILRGIADPNSQAVNDLFEKLGSGEAFSDIQSLAHSGLGQVRVAEMNLINKMNPNRDMSTPAIRAVLDIKHRLEQRQIALGQEAENYAQSHGGTIDRVGWAQHLREWNEGPGKLLSDEEIANYSKLFDSAAPKDEARKKIEEELARRKKGS